MSVEKIDKIKTLHKKITCFMEKFTFASILALFINKRLNYD